MEPQIQELVPARTFTFFPKLPTELRCEIWLQTIPKEPRLIPHSPHQKLAQKDPSRAIYFCINRESRNVYLKKYTLSFPVSQDDRLGLWSNISPYANLEVDLLHWQHDTLEMFESPSMLKSFVDAMSGLQHLAINVDLLDSFSLLVQLMLYPCDQELQDENYGDLEHHICEFKNLKTLTIVEKFERVSERDECGSPKDTSRWYREYQEEGEAQRDLDGREMVSVGREGKDEVIAWFERLVRNRPEWKAPELRFMRIEKSSSSS